MELLMQVAADLPLAAATPVQSEEGRKTIMEALDMRSQEAISSNFRRPCCVKRARKRSWSVRARHFETVNITSGSRLEARLEETVIFQEHKLTALRLPEQRSRTRKKAWM